MSNVSRLTWVVVGYLAVVAGGMVGILATSSEGAGSPLVTVWLGFCALSGLTVANQFRTQQAVHELSNGAMEAKISRVVRNHLASYARDPVAYVADVHRQEAAEERDAVLARKGGS